MKAITITLCCISALLYSQTKRYYYQLTFTDNIVKNTKRNINMVLDVNPKDVKFYEYGFIKTDSLNQIPNGIKNYRGSETRPMLKRNINSFVNINFQQIKGDYFTFSTEDPIKWKLSDETKKTDQYKLQKATTDFGGRHWTAWFASDIMINEGPYKFRGLPGLIFEIYDDEKQFHYKLIKNKNFENSQSTNNFVESYFGETPKEISLAVYNKLFIEYYNDPFAWARTAPEGRWVINVGGKEYKTKNDLKEATENSQRNMRESYNPIEKDKALTLK